MDLKRRLKEAGIPQWKLADRLGVSEFTLCRWLRKPLSGDRLEAIDKALQELEVEA